MPEYPNLESFVPETEPDYEPGKDHPEPELTFAELREANVARCNEVFHKFEDWDGRDWAVALTGEVGEMCNMLKKMRRGEDIPLKELAKEMADIMIYLDLLAASFEVDLAREVILKFNEVSEKRGATIYL